MAGSAPLVVSGRQVAVNADGCSVDDLSFCGAVTVTVPADVRWAELVSTAVAHEWVGIEALAGLTGTVGEVVARGGTAYGERVADVVASVRTWDRVVDRQRTFAYADCRFSSNGSLFGETDRYELLDVSFLFRQGDRSRPIRDAGLAALLGIALGERTSLAQVRAAIDSAAREDGR